MTYRSNGPPCGTDSTKEKGKSIESEGGQFEKRNPKPRQTEKKTKEQDNNTRIVGGKKGKKRRPPFAARIFS